MEIEILSIFATSRNPSELLHYWVAWRNATGRSLSKKLHQVFEINNDIAVSLGLCFNFELNLI